MAVAGFTMSSANFWASHSSPRAEAIPGTCSQVRLPEVPDNLLPDIEHLSRHMRTPMDIDLRIILADENNCHFEVQVHLGRADVDTDKQSITPISQ